MHDHNVKALFGVEDEISQIASKYPKQRRVVKNIGFACFYGAGWRRIQTTFAQGGFPITDLEAKQKLKMLKGYYPEVFPYHEEITEVLESGETIRNLFGRPITMQSHDNVFMQGFNTLIQSSASDLNLRACEKAETRWRAEGLDAHPLLVIHDCIVAEVATAHADRARDILIESMTGFNLETIKLKVEGKISERWTK